ncbi:hypothetical protein V2A60_001016 [Cordyceps javanica]
MNSFPHADGAESTATPTPGGLSTPTTEVEDAEFIRIWLEVSGALLDDRTHDPTPGDILIIVDKTYSRVLACHPGGHLILDNFAEYDMNQAIPERWKWLCTERDNFIGFRNLAGDCFLGHDIWWNFVARATVQEGWEHFMLIKRRKGYGIQSPFYYKFRPLAALSDGSGIKADEPQGTLWGFIKVGEEQ